MKKIISTISILVLTLFFSPPALAKIETTQEEIGSLIIQRTAPESAFLGQKIWITVNLENKGSRKTNINFTERLGNADFDKSQAKYIGTDYKEKFWYYQWTIKLPAKEKTTLAYWLVPEKLGSYVISPAIISLDGTSFNSKSWKITVECRTDKKCNFDAGENYLTCPGDCQTGLADGICDSTQDERCDPDCEKEADIDCQGKPQKIKRQKIIYYYIAGGVLGILALVIIGLIIRKRLRIRG